MRSLLEEAVESHLIADVPVGVFLSSGIDSTALVSLAAQKGASLRTVTVVFPEREFSEVEIVGAQLNVSERFIKSWSSAATTFYIGSVKRLELSTSRVWMGSTAISFLGPLSKRA